MGPAPLGGSDEGRKFPNTKKPLNWQRLGWWWGWGRRFRAMKENAATGVQRTKWRDFHTSDHCQPALTSLRSLSAHSPGQVGAGS